VRTFAELFDDIVWIPSTPTNWITWNIKQKTMEEARTKARRFPEVCRESVLEIGPVRAMKVKEWRYENLSKDGRHVWIQADLTLDGKKEGTRLSAIEPGPAGLPVIFHHWSGGLNATELPLVAGSRLQALVDAFYREAGEEWASKVRILAEHRAKAVRELDSTVHEALGKSASKDERKARESLAKAIEGHPSLASADPSLVARILKMDREALEVLGSWRGRNKAYQSLISEDLVKGAQDLAAVKQVQES
jgi:hypothetical protein